MINNICIKSMTVLDLSHMMDILDYGFKSLGGVFLPRCILENRRAPAGSLEEPLET